MTGPVMDRWYCASCGEDILPGSSLYVGGKGDLQHQVCEGTASCGPVLARQSETDPDRTAPTAGDMVVRAVAVWAFHAQSCPATAEECPECDAGFNQVVLAHKVWSSSRYQGTRL